MLPGNKAEKEVSRRCSGAVGSRDSEQVCFLEWVLSKDHLLGLGEKRAGSFVTPSPPPPKKTHESTNNLEYWKGIPKAQRKLIGVLSWCGWHLQAASKYAFYNVFSSSAVEGLLSIFQVPHCTQHWKKKSISLLTLVCSFWKNNLTFPENFPVIILHQGNF